MHLSNTKKKTANKKPLSKAAQTAGKILRGVAAARKKKAIRAKATFSKRKSTA